MSGTGVPKPKTESNDDVHLNDDVGAHDEDLDERALMRLSDDSEQPASKNEKGSSDGQAGEALPSRGQSSQQQTDSFDYFNIGSGKAQETAKQAGIEKRTDWSAQLKSIEAADKIDTGAAIQQTHKGGGVQVDLYEVAARKAAAGQASTPEAALIDQVVNQAGLEKWQQFNTFLRPGAARAGLGIEKIATGEDSNVAEGQKLIIEAVLAKPEMLMHPDFRDGLRNAYRDMAKARKEAGLPEWQGKLELPNLVKVNVESTKNGAPVEQTRDALIAANEAFQKDGIAAALPSFRKAVESADKIDSAVVLAQRMALFQETADFERQIANREFNGGNTEELKAKRDNANANEWAKYGEHMLPAAVRGNAALAILNGDENRVDISKMTADSDSANQGSSIDSLLAAKKLIAVAANKRPELEFSDDYQKMIKDGFINYFKNGTDKPKVAQQAEQVETKDTAVKETAVKVTAVKEKPLPERKEVIADQEFRDKELGAPLAKPATAGDGKVIEGSNKAELELPRPRDFIPFASSPHYQRIEDDPRPPSFSDDQVNPYLSDQLTGPALAAGLLYLGYKVTQHRLEKRTEALRNLADVGTDSKLKETANSRSFDVLDQNGRNARTLRQVGTLEDGNRAIVIETVSAKDSATIESLKLPADFKPYKHEYGKEYSPIKADIDGKSKSFFINNETGKAFEFKPNALLGAGRLVETADSRRVKVLPNSQMEALNKVVERQYGRNWNAAALITEQEVLLRNELPGRWQGARIAAPHDFDPAKGELGNHKAVEHRGDTFYINKESNQVYRFEPYAESMAKELHSSGNLVEALDVRVENLSKPTMPWAEFNEKAFKSFLNTRDVTRLREFAIGTNNPEQARQAVGAVRSNLRSSSAEFTGAMMQIAASDSLAAGDALESLATNKFGERDASGAKTLQPSVAEFLRSYWKDGTASNGVIDLMNSGRATPAQVLDAYRELGMQDEVAEKSMKELKSPHARSFMAEEVLRQSAPGAPFGGLTFNLADKKEFAHDVSSETRMKAIEILSTTNPQLDYLGSPEPDAAGKTLAELVAQPNAELANRAREALIQRWSTESSTASGGSLSELLVGDRLINFVDGINNLKWPPETANTSELHRKWTEAQKNAANQREVFNYEVDQVVARRTRSLPENEREKWMSEGASIVNRDLRTLSSNPVELNRKFADSPEVLEEREKLAEAQKQERLALEALDKVLEPRRQLLEKFVTEKAAELKIPAPAVKLYSEGRSEIESEGSYRTGRGEMVFHRFQLADMTPANMARVVAHEFTHLEQDHIMIRRLADQIGIDKQATPEQMTRLKDLFVEKTGTPPPVSLTSAQTHEKFLEAVVEKRDGQPLTEAEGKRADALLESNKDRQSERNIERVNNRRIAELKEFEHRLSNRPLESALAGLGNIRETIAEKLGQREFSARLTRSLQDVEQRRSIDGSYNKHSLNVLKNDLLLESQSLRNTLRNQAWPTYRRQYHEVESWTVDGRVGGIQLAAVTPADVAEYARRGTPDAVAHGGTPDAVARGAKPDAVARSGKPDAVAREGTPDAVARGGTPDAVARAGAPETVSTGATKETGVGGDTAEIRSLDRSAGTDALAIKVTPLAEAIVNYSGVSLKTLESSRDAVVTSESFRADKGQANVYNLLANPETGMLQRLKREGKIPTGWDIFPTEPGSPADKAGADYFLINRQTGEFHMLDATKRDGDTKKNVFELRKNGIIVYDGFYFDQLGSLKRPETGSESTEMERNAETFGKALEKQIVDLTKTKSPFVLGETPLPSVRATTHEAGQYQIGKMIEWANQKHAATRDDKFKDMAVILRNAESYEKIKSVEQKSPTLSTKTQTAAEREIARFVASKVLGEPYKPADPSKSKSNVTLVKGVVSLRTAEGERFEGGSVGVAVQSAYGQLVSPPKLLAQLQKGELEKLNVNANAFKGLSGKARIDEFERAYRDRSHPEHAKVRYVADNLNKTLISSRAEIEAGGALGRGEPVITNSIVNSLKSQNDFGLLDRPDPNAKTEVELAAEAQLKARNELAAKTEKMKTELPNSGPELQKMVGERVSGTAPVPQVSEWMEAMLTEQQDKSAKPNTRWSDVEVQKFKTLAEAYNRGEARAVELVHSLVNQPFATAEFVTPPEPVARSNRPKPVVGADRAGVVPAVARDLAADGTTAGILDGQHPTAKLSWRERLTDRELVEMKEAQRLYEERLKRGQTLSEAELQTLESLRYLDKNKYDPRVHQELIRQIDRLGAKNHFSRPEGGFKAGSVSGPLTAMSILLTAALGTYISSHESENTRPFKAAAFR